LSEVPLFANTPSFIENLSHLFKAVERFPHLMATLSETLYNLIMRFHDSCQQNFNSFDQTHAFHAGRMLANPEVITEFRAHPLLQQCVFEGKEDDLEPLMPSFFELERRLEDNLLTAKTVLDPEMTVRERFQLPTTATIVESLIVLHDKVQEFLAGSVFDSPARARIGNGITSVEQLIATCILFLHVEMRCKCYAEIVPALRGAGYYLTQPSTGPDTYATALANIYQGEMERLTPVLTSSRLLFVFIGIPRLVYSLHITFLPHVREINEKGGQAIIQNLAHFKHLFSGFKYPEVAIYAKAHFIAQNIALSAKQLFLLVQENQKWFTIEEVLPIFEMPDKASDPMFSAQAIRELYHV
jgi:hypothetical protein